MIKDILKFKNGKALSIKFPIELFDSNGNITYCENSNGFWTKREYTNGKQTYYETSRGFWFKREYTNGKQTYYETSRGYWSKSEYTNGNLTYYEDSDGLKEGTSKTKTVELTVSDVEKLVGHKVKIVNVDK